MSTKLAHIQSPDSCYSVEVIQFGMGTTSADPCNIHLGLHDSKQYIYCRLDYDQVSELIEALDKYQRYCYNSLQSKEERRLNEIRKNQTC